MRMILLEEYSGEFAESSLVGNKTTETEFEVTPPITLFFNIASVLHIWEKPFTD
jgi:hypothetical protein